MEPEIINSKEERLGEGRKMPTEFESCKPTVPVVPVHHVHVHGDSAEDTTCSYDHAKSRIKTTDKKLPNGVIQHQVDSPKSIDSKTNVHLLSTKKCQDCDKMKICRDVDDGLDLESLHISPAGPDVDYTEESSKDSGVEELAAKLLNSLRDGAESDNSPTEASSSAENKNIEIDTLLGINYVVYESEKQMPDIMTLITKDLSEPYSIYTYRYFIHNWPKLCFLAMDGSHCVGAIVCKLDMHKNMVRRGYIAMLAVDENYRRRKIGSHLVLKAIRAMVKDECDEVVLETEITNKAALKLYENLGFVRDKRLFRYYLNGVDALRLKLWLR
ncbi:N-alpha-acetyltransferase 30-like [Lineus longissimus]|uniref:N-alpha-acetyltransferase 30-like n=1 Tax=Lineus longissimus TaxID=88925 RepID=UPI00315CEF54